MSQKVVIACQGWMTDPNALAVAPAGALKTARDVMIRIPNTIEPRPGFREDETFVPTTLTAMRSLVEWNNGATTRFLVANRTSASAYTISYNNGDAVSNFGGAYTGPQDDPHAYHSFFVSRNNLYINGTDNIGPAKLTSGIDQACQKTCSEPVLFTALATAAGAPITNLYSVAHRVVIRRKDANGYITRSAPSNYYRRYNNLGGVAYTTMYVRLPDACEAGDVIEVYRSKMASGDVAVADEMYLALEQTVLSADLGTNRYATVVDLCPEANLGAALYTNASQQGILKGNAPPPAAMTTAVWSGCAWYGNVLERPRVLLNIHNVNGTVASNNPYLGIHDFVTTTNIAPASTTVTVAAGQAHNVYIGQYLSAVILGTAERPDIVGSVFAANTQVTNYNSATGVVTFSPAAIGAHASGETVVFCDAVYVGSNAGDSHYIAFNNDSGRCFNTTIAATAQETAAEQTIRSMSLLNIVNLANGGASGHIILPIETTSSGGAFVIQADGNVTGIYVGITLPTDFTNATTKRPPITPTDRIGWNAGAGTAYTDYAKYNRLYYSKPDEPEACPDLNYIDIGRADQRIIKLVPLRDSLLVFKYDGIWRISGSAPDQWRVDLVTEDYRPINGRMITSLGETAYAWTNKGIISVSAYGDVNKIDTPIHDQVEAVYLNNYSSILVPTDAVMSTMHAVTHERLGIVIFQMPARPTQATDFVSPDRDTVSGTLGNNATTKFMYCYCPETQAWFEWDMRADATTAGMFHRQEGKLMFARGGTSKIRKERLGYYQGDGAGYYDATHAVTIGSSSATGCTIAVGSTGYEYVQNDYIFQGSSYYRIGRNWALTAVILDDWSATGSPTPISDGAATIYESIKPVIEWQPQGTGSAVGARWAEMAIHFSDIHYGLDVTSTAFRLTLGGGADDDSSDSSEGPAPISPKNAVYRSWIPRSLHRSNKITPFIAMYAIRQYFKIHGLTLIYQPTSEKGRRDVSG